MAHRDDAAPAQTASVLKTSLDKDLRKIERLEEATRSVTRNLPAVAVALLFLVIAGVLASYQIGAEANALLIIVAAVIGGYTALTIGANDVANNVGPAVGARALTMTGALVIAAIFECAGALIAGGDVVRTISQDIVDPALILRQPGVRVGHDVGATRLRTVGASCYLSRRACVDDARDRRWRVGGWHCRSRHRRRQLARRLGHRHELADFASVGGIVAALFLAFIKVNLIYQDDKIGAARRWVPALVALMAATFIGYLIVKGLSHIWRPGLLVVGTLTILTYSPDLRGGQALGLRPIGRHGEPQSVPAEAVQSAADLLRSTTLLRPRLQRRGQCRRPVGGYSAQRRGGATRSRDRSPVLGDADRRRGHQPRAVSVRASHRAHRRRRDHQNEPDAGLLCRALGGPSRFSSPLSSDCR